MSIVSVTEECPSRSLTIFGWILPSVSVAFGNHRRNTAISFTDDDVT